MGERLRLIVGLGNPGHKYDQTRHNAGFWFVDEVARRCAAQWSVQSRFMGETARVAIDGVDVWLLKPATYMNKSGQSVAALAGFYRIDPGQLVVAHDEIDLPPGDVRFKFGGGHGGHNGLRDIFSHLGREFWRVRLGVGHPGLREQVVDYVLGRPERDEMALIASCIERAANLLPRLVAGDSERAMHALHSR